MESFVQYFRFNGLLQESGWLMPAYVGVNGQGVISYLSSEAPAGAAVESVNGFALPGFLNAHSHAFQYAMAGTAERHPGNISDDFWTWREAMYRCALSVDPDQAQAIATMLYAEMLRNGFTHVAEFHYLHHDKDGRPYSNIAEMGERMLAAAATAGIRITLIPVFYQKGGFGLPPQERQRRFISKTSDDYFKLLDATFRAVKSASMATPAFSVHSLRAVDGADIKRTFSEGPKDLPFHLHVSEQKKEVSDCVEHTGKRPMQWLFDNLEVNSRFHLVHSTHLDDSELDLLARSGAHVVLCPSTEGNLGDGIFRMREYYAKGGRWSIGTDSHIGLQPLEELRMIDYRQRLVSNFRNTFRDDGANYMITSALRGGRQAMRITSSEFFRVGDSFDSMVINAAMPILSNAPKEHLLPAIVYHHDASSVLGTIVNGKWVVKNQRHFRSKEITLAFAKAMKALQ